MQFVTSYKAKVGKTFEQLVLVGKVAIERWYVATGHYVVVAGEHHARLESPW